MRKQAGWVYVILLCAFFSCTDSRFDKYESDSETTSIPIPFEESASRTTDFPLLLDFSVAGSSELADRFSPVLDPLRTYWYYLHKDRLTVLGAYGIRGDWLVMLRAKVPLEDLGQYVFHPGADQYDPALMLVVRDLRIGKSFTLLARSGTLEISESGTRGEYLAGTFSGEFIVGEGSFVVPTGIELSALKTVQIRDGRFKLRHEDRPRSKSRGTRWEKWPRFQ